MREYYLEFQYDKWGRGILRLHNDSIVVWERLTRTGSVNQKLQLVNAIRPGVWTLQDLPVSTTEKGMWVGTPLEGWKCRLYSPEGRWTHYLIHPDGGLGGTRGCLGTQAGNGVDPNAIELRTLLTEILQRKQPHIRVYVNTPTPGPNGPLEPLPEPKTSTALQRLCHKFLDWWAGMRR